jgi:hypothetical protein
MTRWFLGVYEKGTLAYAGSASTDNSNASHALFSSKQAKELSDQPSWFRVVSHTFFNKASASRCSSRDCSFVLDLS